ncbi:MAG: hypothetical protein N3A67_02955, partial [Ignavibacteria bacterium]|nr:hypothetical protein [Ignavibacteria bacterium]
MKNNRYKYRKTIEIYFVLYLAALIFLIPSQKERDIENANRISMETPFAIKLEKSALFCKMAIDTIPYLLHLDSLNTIYFTGDVKNISYEVIIEDQVYKSKLKLVSNVKNQSVNFRLIDILEKKISYFVWKPPTFDKINKSYIVYLNAKATDTKTGNELVAKAQFALVINYYDKKTGLPVIQEQPAEQIVQNLQPPQMILSDANFSLQYDRIRTIASFDWQNTLFVLGGLNPLLDLQKNIEVSIKHYPEGNGGSAYISNILSNSIVIKGTSPNYGNIVVTLSLKRRTDNKEYQMSFPIVAEPIANPEIPNELYPGLTYKIKPNLPILPGYEAKVLIRDNDNIRYQQFSDEVISFTPDYQDTSGNIFLERYINNKLLGQRIKLNVKKFAPPVIVKLSKIDSKTVLVQTNSFGLFKNRENTILSLDIQGNATYKERIGQFKSDREKLIWSQFF